MGVGGNRSSLINHVFGNGGSLLGELVVRAREGVEERRTFDVRSRDAAALTLFGGARGALVRDRMVPEAGKINVLLRSKEQAQKQANRQRSAGLRSSDAHPAGLPARDSRRKEMALPRSHVFFRVSVAVEILGVSQ